VGFDGKKLIPADERTQRALEISVPAGTWLRIADEADAKRVSELLPGVVVQWTISTVAEQIWVVVFARGKVVRELRYAECALLTNEGSPLPFEDGAALRALFAQKPLLASPHGYDVLQAFLGGDYQDAAISVEKLEALLAEAVVVHQFLGLVDADTTLLEQSLQDLESPAATESMLWLAFLLGLDEANEELLDLSRVCCERDPGPVAHTYVMEGAVRCGAFREAIAHADVLLREVPDDTKARLARGKALLALGEVDAAMADLAQVMDRTELETLKQDLAEAPEVLPKPTDSVAQGALERIRSVLTRRLEAHRRAAAELRRKIRDVAIADMPAAPEALDEVMGLGVGRALSEMGDADRLRLLRLFEALDSATWSRDVATTLINLKEYAQVEARVEARLKAKPDDFRWMVVKAQLLAARRDLDGAALLLKMIAEGPDESAADEAAQFAQSLLDTLDDPHLR
jgi:tetratricopeptide (TPR) repeat protein